MARGRSKVPWSRRQWAVYWLFIVAVAVAVVMLTRAVNAGNLDSAGCIIAVSLVVAVIAFITWVVRLLRRP